MERIDKGWTAMHTLLDEKMPQKKKRRKFIFFWLFSAVLVLGSAFVYHKYTLNENEHVISKYVELENDKTSNVTKSQLSVGNNLPKENITKDDKIKSNAVNINNSNTITKDVSKTSLASESINIKENKKIIKATDVSKTSAATNNKTQTKTPQTNSRKSESQNSKPLKLSEFSLNQNTDKEFVHTVSDRTKSDSPHKGMESPNTTEFISSKKDVIADLDLLASLQLYKALSYDYNLSTLADHRLIDVANKSNPNQMCLNFGASTSGSYFLNENVLGITPALFMEIEKNHKWGIGLEIGATFAKRNNNNSEELRAEDLNVNSNEDIDFPAGLGTGFNNEVLADEDRGKALDIYTSSLNSIGVGLYGYLNVNNKLRFNIGIGLDHFYNKKTLNNVYVSNQDALLNGPSDPALGTRLFSQSKLISNSTIGISYAITDNFELFSNYKHAWINLVEESDFTINTSSIQFGTRYTF